jgi:hypothetical protein
LDADRRRIDRSFHFFRLADSPSELRTSSRSVAEIFLIIPAKTRRPGSFSFRGSNDTPAHDNPVDLIDADLQLDFGSRSKQSSLTSCHRENIATGNRI